MGNTMLLLVVVVSTMSTTKSNPSKDRLNIRCRDDEIIWREKYGLYGVVAISDVYRIPTNICLNQTSEQYIS